MREDDFRYLYRDFVLTVSSQFEREFSSILANHNFEFGPEFEIVLCNVLGHVLPDSYGVCRGYVVNAFGECAGEDIIVFDKLRYPTLARSAAERVSRKEYVPCEAVYAYIEAKHCLELKEDNGQGIIKALKQVSDVRQLCRERGIPAKQAVSGSRDELYCMIASRGVRSGGKKIDSPSDAVSSFPASADLGYPAPDCIVCGKDVIATPVNEHQGVRNVSDVFIRHESCYIEPRCVDGVAFGIAVISLLHALKHITLCDLPTWQILINAFNRDFSKVGAVVRPFVSHKMNS